MPLARSVKWSGHQITPTVLADADRIIRSLHQENWQVSGTLQQRIRAMVADGILTGRFRAGEKMPSSRGLAEHIARKGRLPLHDVFSWLSYHC